MIREKKSLSVKLSKAPKAPIQWPKIKAPRQLRHPLEGEQPHRHSTLPSEPREDAAVAAV